MLQYSCLSEDLQSIRLLKWDKAIWVLSHFFFVVMEVFYEQENKVPVWLYFPGSRRSVYDLSLQCGRRYSTVKTISIRLEDSVYEELGEMLEAMGQTKQTFYETYTKTALRERSIPFIISAPVSKKAEKKMTKWRLSGDWKPTEKSFLNHLTMTKNERRR